MVGELARIAAETLPVWRDGVVVVLACVVIGLLLLVAAAWGET